MMLFEQKRNMQLARWTKPKISKVWFEMI
jgi:hypothetical protein